MSKPNRIEFIKNIPSEYFGGTFTTQTVLFLNKKLSI